jgi:hypothetical protein
MDDGQSRRRPAETTQQQKKRLVPALENGGIEK